MAATVMPVEFGTIHHYSNLTGKILRFVCAVFLSCYKKLSGHYVNYDILVYSNHVLKNNMNTN